MGTNRNPGAVDRASADAAPGTDPDPDANADPDPDANADADADANANADADANANANANADADPDPDADAGSAPDPGSAIIPECCADSGPGDARIVSVGAVIALGSGATGSHDATDADADAAPRQRLCSRQLPGLGSGLGFAPRGAIQALSPGGAPRDL